MSIGTRLRGERERLGLSQTAFGSTGGVGKGAQVKYEAGERFPGADYLASVAGLGVDVLFVITGRREPGAAAKGAGACAFEPDAPGADGKTAGAGRFAGQPPVRPDTPHPHVADAPARWANAYPVAAATVPAQQNMGAPLVWAVGAGSSLREYQVIPNITERVCAGLAAGDGKGATGAAHDQAGYIAFERGFMAATLGSDEARYMTLTVEGDSMAPTLLNGDLVAIDITANRINVSGVYVLRFAGELTIKRVMRKSDGAVVVASDNRAYAQADESFTAAAAETLNVVGRMVWPRVR